MSGPESGETRSRAGFSIIEQVMALIVLAFGVVGLATTTLFITRQLTLAEVTTARANAVRSVMERIHATPYGLIGPGSDSIGPMAVSWTVTEVRPQVMTMSIVILGPGLASVSGGQTTPTLSSGVADTLVYRVLNP